MDAQRPGPTPYGACANTLRINRFGLSVPDADANPPAAGTIGKFSRITVSLNPSGTESAERRLRRGRRTPGRRTPRCRCGGIDWAPARHLAARSQHGGIDWDCLVRPAARAQDDGIDGARARDRGEGTP